MRASIQNESATLEQTVAEATVDRGLNEFYCRKIFSLDSAVGKTQSCLASMGAS